VPYNNKSSGSKIADLNEYFGMGYELSLGATYLLMKELKAGAGFLYTESGAKGKYFETSNTALHCSANPPLDSIGLCAGATYTVYDMDITAGILWTHYLPQKFDYTETAGPGHVTVEGEYKKDVIDIALGLSRKW
jgi:long-subunit fatty acid transport protein